MNEFTEQFILESRELIDQGAASLIALEVTPNNAERLDELLRAFHTLKGGASIVEFAAMERTLHAMEEVLSPLRSGALAITRKSIDDSQACLDLVARWLDRTEQTGELPLDVQADEDKFMARIQSAAKDRETATSIDKNQQGKSRTQWLDKLMSNHGEAAQSAQTALRFSPHPDCFLRGEDPLAVIATVPELLALELEPIDAWPPLEALDPFQSNLTMVALSAADAAAIQNLLQAHASECEVIAIGSGLLARSPATEIVSPLPHAARTILEVQLKLLAETDTRTFVGRVGSAGRVAENVFHRCEFADMAEQIAKATASAIEERNAGILGKQITEGLRIAIKTAQLAPEMPAQAAALPRTLRVNADQIDALVRITSELTIVKNAIGHAVKLALADESTFATALKNSHSALDHITSELQRAALGMRVLPLRSVFQRFTRVVREMSETLNKPAKLVIEGGDTDADKAIVEMLFEPLLHVIRNSMDHGIEDAKVRAQRNKPAVATLGMHAMRTGEHVVIEVYDDGGGIDVERVREVAIERGIVTAEVGAHLSEAEVIDLIFAPSFSTATKVTELSGRGVGMDAVRTAVARVGGKVSIQNSFQAGATVRFTLPFSVLMTHVMTVESDGQMFGIPIETIVETVSISTHELAAVGAARALVRRDRTIPVFDLASILNTRQEVAHKSEVVIVIVAFVGQLVGIEVDRIGERMEVMMKPLEGILSAIPGITGTTILGDGRVLLVLDLEGAFQ